MLGKFVELYRARANRMHRTRVLTKARSSVGERFPDTEEVGGSIPPVPTMIPLCWCFVLRSIR